MAREEYSLYDTNLASSFMSPKHSDSIIEANFLKLTR